MSIIDDVFQGLSKEVNRVQERGQEMFQSFNLTSQIKDLERKRAAKLVEIGKLIVDKHHRQKDVSEDSIKEKVAEAVGFEDQIAILQAELDQIKVQNDPSTPASKKAEAKAGYHPTPGFDCPHCNTPVSKDKKFCPACGGDIESQSDDGPVDVETAESENGNNNSADAGESSENGSKS